MEVEEVPDVKRESSPEYEKLAEKYNLIIKVWIGQGTLLAARGTKGICRAIVDRWLHAFMSNSLSIEKTEFREDMSRNEASQYASDQKKYESVGSQAKMVRKGPTNLLDYMQKIESKLTNEEVKLVNKVYQESMGFADKLIEEREAHPHFTIGDPVGMTYTKVCEPFAIADYSILAAKVIGVITHRMPVFSLSDLVGATVPKNAYRRFFRLRLVTEGAGHAIGIIGNANLWGKNVTNQQRLEFMTKRTDFTRYRLMDPNSAEYSRIKPETFHAFFRELMTMTYGSIFIGGKCTIYEATRK